MSKDTISVKASKEGYRRAGYAFSATKAISIPLEDLTKEQIKALKNDPNLVVNASGAKSSASDKKAEQEAADKITKAYEDAAEDIEKLKADAAKEIADAKKIAADEIKSDKADAVKEIAESKKAAVEENKADKAKPNK